MQFFHRSIGAKSDLWVQWAIKTKVRRVHLTSSLVVLNVRAWRSALLENFVMSLFFKIFWRRRRMHKSTFERNIIWCKQSMPQLTFKIKIFKSKLRGQVNTFYSMHNWVTSFVKEHFKLYTFTNWGEISWHGPSFDLFQSKMY